MAASSAITVIDNLVYGNISNIPGAVYDGIRNDDGAMTSLIATGTGTTATTPSYTTNAANETVLNIYCYFGTPTFTGPSGTGIANIVTMTPTSGDYSCFVYSQTVTSSGGTAGNLAATLGTSTQWAAITVPIIPSGTISLATTKNQQASGNTNTVGLPSGTASGQIVLSCLAFSGPSTTISNLVGVPTGGTVFANYKVALNGSQTTQCAIKKAGASEPGGGYTFTQSNGVTTASTSFAVAITNGSYPDELLTSASASFASTDVNKDIGVGSQAWGGYGVVTMSAGPTATRNQGPNFSSSMVGSYMTLVGSGTYLISAFTDTSHVTLTGAPTTTQYTSYVPFQPQSQGIIQSVVSATQVEGWGIWNTSVGTANMTYTYGTDNTVVLQNKITNLPNGGTIKPAQGILMFDGYGQTPITITGSAPINFRGEGAGSRFTDFYGGNTPTLTTVGTELYVSSTTLSSPAITVGTGSPVRQTYDWSNLSITCGEGRNGDGCGSDAIEFLNPNGLVLYNVIVSNAAGANIHDAGSSYKNQVTHINVGSFDAGTSAWNLDSSSGGSQNFVSENSKYELGKYAAIQFEGPSGGQPFWSFTSIGDDISEGSMIPSSGAFLYLDSNTNFGGDCSFIGTYMEWDQVTQTNLASTSQINNCTFMTPRQVFGSSSSFTNVPQFLTTQTTVTTCGAGGTGCGSGSTALSFTSANASGAQTITGLSYTLAPSTNYNFHCDLQYSQATVVSDNFGINFSQALATDGGSVSGMVTTNTTAMNKESAASISGSGGNAFSSFTPGATGVQSAVFGGVIRNGTVANTATLTWAQSTAADVAVIQGGCNFQVSAN